MIRSTVNPVLLSSCLLILSACGGGGGGGNSGSGPIAVNQPPSLTVDATVTVLEGSTQVVTASGSDPEGRPLTYSLASGGDSQLFLIAADGNLSFKVAPDYENPVDVGANNSYELTVELTDSQSAKDSQQVVVTVTNAIEGRVVDAPLAGSATFIDLNNNLIADVGEPTGISNTQGYFAVSEPEDGNSGRLVSLGGKDIITGVEMEDLALIADLPSDLSDAVTVSPLSSVIAGAEGDQAKAAILTAMGIDGSVDDFLAMDIWALAESGDQNAQQIQQVNQQIALIMIMVQALAATEVAEELAALSENTATSIATQIGSNGVMNFQSVGELTAIISRAMTSSPSVTAEVIAAVADNMVDINEAMSGESADPTSPAAIDFMHTIQTTLRNSVIDVVAGDTSLDAFIAQTDIQSVFSNNDFYNSQIDTDNDGTVNLIDTDDDGDNVADAVDAFPLDANESVDTDGDQIGNNADTDDDGDGVLDTEDTFPLDAAETQDSDLDGIGDNADTDDAVQTVYVRLNSGAFDAPYYLFSSTEGGTAETLELVRGKVYKFIRTDDGHPFNLGSGWRTGLSDVLVSSTSDNNIINGIGSIAKGQSLTIRIPSDYTETSLNYYCYTHEAMVASIAIIDPPTTPGLNEGDTAVLIDGVVADIWGGNLKFSAFDSLSGPNGYADCTDQQAGTETCDSIDWAVVADTDKGDVLEVSYSANAGHAGIVVGPSPSVDLSDYSAGQLEFDIKVVNSGTKNLSSGFKIKLETTPEKNSGEIVVSQIAATGNWEAISIPLSTLTTGSQLDLSSVTAPLVFFPAIGTSPGVVYRIDNMRFSGIADGSTPPTDNSGGGGSQGPADYTVDSYGAGSIADTIYTASHRCKDDYGYWVENAGVISTQRESQIQGCNQGSGIPTGVVTKLYPQLTGPAASKPTQTHKWWGSVSFLGEMTVGDAADAAYITPDPITARITNKGVRVMGIPSGLRIDGVNNFYYPIPDHASEVFDGIAIGNSDYANLEAYTKDHSEGSVTVMWKDGETDVMEATFVHGSPYIYFKAYSGNFEVRTLSPDNVAINQKGTFGTGDNVLGIWTNVSGNANNYLLVGEGATTFANISGNEIEVNNSAKEMTLVYLPHLQPGTAPSAMIDLFASKARNTVTSVDIDYQVDGSTNEVTVTHRYMDDQGMPVETIAGMHPLHWKNTSQATTNYKIRSARGMVKFAEVDEFSYQIPYVGVLPTLPVTGDSLDQTTLKGLVTDFVEQGSGTWNLSSGGAENTDTYWSGKSYGKVAELAAIANSLDMQSEADQLINWLKAELEDWFTAETDGTLNTKKYFVYDDDWNTLFGFDESYGSHQRLADHHFHYGYFVRAAAEICRVDLAWCGEDQYGPMIELLIRDYAADKDDPLFPHMRNFDPANGFSWADGQVNFIRGNNNESTSEAATAYGAIILYGLITENTALTERGMYLHASTGATYWEYWNNIDGYNNVSADADNFPAGYNRITTSIIWGDGAVFSTWFSGAYAHILGIQGLPSSPLILHVGLHAEYMEEYVALGLKESSNRKPSGLIADQWRDLWWNLWAMVDADAAIADFNSVSSYTPEAGETKAHTYHWIHTFSALGQLATGTGALTSDYPAALAFTKDGVTTYVVYNFTDQQMDVSYSDGQKVTAAPNAFTLISN
jgi:endo-1,3(4)-beta-glucanase